MTIRVSVFLLLGFLFSCVTNKSSDTNLINYGKFEDLEEARLFGGTVRELFLTNDSEYEEFPEVIFEFRSLKSLAIFGNDCDFIRESNPCKHISVIPRDILYLKQLEVLFLPTNRIKKLPEYLKDLDKLRVLDLTFNRGIDISNIGQLSNLEELYLNDCNLQSLPDNLGNLKKLKRLGLQFNPLSDSEREKIRELLPNCEIGF